MWIIIVLLLILTAILIYLLLHKNKTETWTNPHLLAHFGGTPNMSQIWPYMVKYPKQYV